MFRSAQHDRPTENKQEGPAGFPAGPFVKLLELSSRCHAASAWAAGTATTAVGVTRRDRFRTRQRQNCCNQKQIFHDFLLLRFRESSAAEQPRNACVFCAEPNAKRESIARRRSRWLFGSCERGCVVDSKSVAIKRRIRKSVCGWAEKNQHRA
jgi:hypothetical protein